MNTRLRIATCLAVPAVAIGALAGGTAQAHAVTPTEAVSTVATAAVQQAKGAAASIVPSAFTPGLCKKYRWVPPICPRQP